MKNKTGLLSLTGILAVTAAFSFTAFAQETLPLLPAPSGGSSIVQGDAATADLVAAEQTQAMPSFVTTTGKIESVTNNDNGVSISITNDDMGMVYHLQEGVAIINREDNSYLQLSDLKEGMEITGVVPANSAQTMSLPPQTSAAVALIVNTGEGFTSVGRFDDELLNQADSLALNIGDDTVIVDQKGSKKVFTADDVKNQDCIVFYTVTTRSIPAQTTPSFVMILDTQAPADSEPAAEAPVAASERQDASPVMPQRDILLPADSVALRATAEAAGYTVTWTANDQPVVLEKDGVQVSITVGQTEYTKNGQQAEGAMAAELRDGQIFIAADVAEALQ